MTAVVVTDIDGARGQVARLPSGVIVLTTKASDDHIASLFLDRAAALILADALTQAANHHRGIA